MRLPFNSVWYSIKDYLIIIFGLLLYALGWVGFLIPNEITTGGVTGISALIYYGTGIPISVSYFVINVLLLLAAIKVLGLQFCIRTIFSVIVCSSFLSILPLFIKDALVDEQPFMSAIIGGILCGSGIGLVFVSNGSTGGTDIIAAVINKYRDISLGRALMFCDIAIVSSSYFVFHESQKVVFGFCVLIISMIMLDYYMNSARQSVQFLIFSNKYDEIAEAIGKQLDRGVTILNGEGWYSKEPRKVLVVLAKRREGIEIFRLIHRIDPKAFVSQSNVVGVYGEGFDKLKIK